MDCWVVGMVCCRYVHARAERVTAGFVGAKQARFRQIGPHFASVASIINALDQTADRAAFTVPLTPPAPILMLGGHAILRTTRAKVQAIPSEPDVQVGWVTGSSGLQGKLADAIGKPV